jgi:hypothetical protein
MMHDASQTTPIAWRQRLGVLIQDRMTNPFAWGSQDCCLWAADCVLAVSGVDYAAPFRGRYGTAAGALDMLREAGGIEALADQVGPRIPVMMAAFGDIGLVRLEDRQLLAVCAGEVWLAPAAAGLAARPLPEASIAWRVSHG